MTTSGLVLPPSMAEVWTPHAIPRVEPLVAPEEDASDEEKNLALPKPTGWRILCAVPKMPETFGDSQIVRPDSYARQEEHATTILFVLDVGPDAYKDKEKFPAGPWCKKGDFILCRTYSGTRFKVFGNEFRLLNDDQVDAVVPDPRGITRA